MVRTSYLRVYQPLDRFSSAEQARWKPRAREDPPPPASPEEGFSRRWLLAARLPSADPPLELAEGAFVLEREGAILVCPWRTRLRMLAGLVAFRGSVPDEVADVFVPEAEARRAALELDEMGRRYPLVRSHILHANWHVPIRWFAAFADSERVLTEDSSGLRIRYEARLADAVIRVRHAVEVLERSWIDDSVTAAVLEMAAWLEDFFDDGIVELDYGSVARMFSDDDLVDDHSASAVTTCLKALTDGDVIGAGRMFGELNERWARLRVNEVVN